MDNLGPRLRHLTRPAQLDQPRFTLEWALPLEPGLETYATLFDSECFPPHAVAASHGPDEADTLLELWTTLIDHHEPVEAVAYVAEAYAKRTGRQPARAR